MLPRWRLARGLQLALAIAAALGSSLGGPSYGAGVEEGFAPALGESAQVCCVAPVGSGVARLGVGAAAGQAGEAGSVACGAGPRGGTSGRCAADSAGQAGQDPYGAIPRFGRARRRRSGHRGDQRACGRGRRVSGRRYATPRAPAGRCAWRCVMGPLDLRLDVRRLCGGCAARAAGAPRSLRGGGSRRRRAARRAVELFGRRGSCPADAADGRGARVPVGCGTGAPAWVCCEALRLEHAAACGATWHPWPVASTAGPVFSGAVGCLDGGVPGGRQGGAAGQDRADFAGDPRWRTARSCHSVTFGGCCCSGLRCWAHFTGEGACSRPVARCACLDAGLQTWEAPTRASPRQRRPRLPLRLCAL